jgi:hypothetical protein
LPNNSTVWGVSSTGICGNTGGIGTKLTAASLHAHNNATSIKVNLGTTANGSATTAMDPEESKQSQPRTGVPKVLPELPLSNRKLLLQSLKRNNKINNSTWSSSLPMVCSSIPPLVPPPRVALSTEKLSRLHAILAESDSEDERIIIPKTTEGFDIGKYTLLTMQVGHNFNLILGS